jgi:hypothetical protein
MIRHLRMGFVVVSGCLLSTLCFGDEPPAKPIPPPQSKMQPGAPTPKPADKIKVADATPEDALRTFMLALMAQDGAALRAVVLPNPDLEWLLKGQPLPPDVIKDAMAQFAKRPMKRLKEGEKVALPRGQQYIVTASEVGEDRAVLLPEGSTVPTRVQKVKGHWKVSADPLIAARKSADAARQKVEARKAAAKN